MRLGAGNEVAATAFLGLSILLALVNLAVWLLYAEPAPYADMIDVEWFLSRWSLSEDGLGSILGYPDNEHRVFLPLLLQAVDHHVFASTGYFLILVHVACLGATALAFARHAALGLGRGTPAARAAAAAMVLAFLWSAHWLNVVWTKQTLICLALASTALGFWLIARTDRRIAAVGAAPWAALGAGGLLLINAGWSFAAGLLALPVALGFALVRPWSWAARGAVAGATGFVLIARALAPPTAAPTLIENPDDRLIAPPLYVLNFLGSPSRQALGGDEVLAPLLAAAALALAAPLLWRALRAPAEATTDLSADQRQAASFFALAAIWAFGVAAGSALMRAGYGPEQGFSTRYLPFGLVFLASVAMLAATLRAGLPKWTRRTVLWVGGFYVFALVATTPRGWLMTAEHHREIALGAVAAQLGIDDAQYALYPRPGFAGGRVLELLALYEAENAALYRSDWARLIGANAADVSGPGRCPAPDAAAAFALLDGGGLRVAARVDGASPTWLAVVDAQGAVAGLARRGERFRTPPVPDLPGAQYAGFARVEHVEAAELWAVEGGGLCRLERG